MEYTAAPTRAMPIDEGSPGHYHIRGLLGEGGFGQVFEAWDAQLCRPVALKRLRSLDGSPPSAALLDEARRAASLRHAAFVRIFAITGHGTDQSIVMELVQGQTLRQLLKAAAPPCHAALEMVAQIAEAMAEAHGLGLVHGDLKPSNLMLDTRGKVRILDFGLACHVDALATGSGPPTDAQGTFAYMAPERLLGHPLTAACDVYALGVLLYEMLAGQRPFAELDGLALAAAHMQTPPQAWPLPAHLDPAVVRLVRAMTARDPAQRIASMQAVVDALHVLPSAPGARALAVSSAVPAAAPIQTAHAAYPLAPGFFPAACGHWEISMVLTVRWHGT